MRRIIRLSFIEIGVVFFFVCFASSTANAVIFCLFVANVDIINVAATVASQTALRACVHQLLHSLLLPVPLQSGQLSFPSGPELCI